jgi:phage portal protein BeeE
MSFAAAKARARTQRALIEKQVGGLGLGAEVSGPLGNGMGGQWSRSNRSQQAYSFFKSWVYVATNAIAKRMAGQPICAGEIVNADPNPERRPSNWTKDRLPNRLKAAANQEDLEILPTHPALDLFARPNPVQKRFEFLYSSAINMLITGESYWVAGTVGGGEEGQKLELWSVPTNWVEPKHDGALFTGYVLRLGNRKIELPPENIARTYFPHPTDIKGAWSPLFSMIEAVQVDEHIQHSQKQMFERGIFPNVVITIGREKGPDGKLTDRRPVLEGHHRRQITSAVNEIWNETVNAGDPAIIDGLIESVHKLHNTPQEMNWIESGEAAKRRVMQTYGVNPISVGEIIGANRAQAAEAENQTCQQAVNPLVDAFSETATDFVGPMYDTPARLQLWIEKAKPIDEDLEQTKWDNARANDDVTRDEYRAHRLNLPPDEREYKNKLLNDQQGLAHAITILQGTIKPELASRLFQTFFELEEADADKLAGVDLKKEEPELPALPAPPAGQAPPPPQGQQEGDEEPEAENLEQLAASVAELRQKLEGAQHDIVVAGRTLYRAVEAALDGHFRDVAKLTTAPAPKLGVTDTEIEDITTGEGDAKEPD